MPLFTSWVDGVGQAVNAVFLNALDTAVNAAYVKPGGGIPSSDMTAAVQASLALADLVDSKIATAQLTTINPQTASYTLVLADAGMAVEITNASATNLTVPPNSSVAYPIGTFIEVAQTGTGQITVVPGSGVTLNYASSAITRVQWSTIGLRKRATNTWIISGDTQ